MYRNVWSGSVYGVEGRLIAVEVDLSNGLPLVNIVGLPDPAIRESIDRVRAAVKNCGFSFPLQRITVNLAPADLRKEGTAFDLAIAAGILTASGQLQYEPFDDTLVLGEVALNGEIRAVTGVLAMAEQAKRSGMKRILVPAGNALEASFIEEMEIFAISHLQELADGNNGSWDDLRFDRLAEQAPLERCPGSSVITAGDYSDVLGQHHAKRALLIAAAGGHNVLLTGPPGTGKTMLVRRLPGIMPPLEEDEALQVTKIYSAAGKLPGGFPALMSERPFRTPHHTISAAGLVGGGSIPRPGEVTLAHHGVLFLDELPEFSRSSLEVLRQPLEDREVTIARSRAVFRFPSHFLLAASMNPCPCGFYAHETEEQRCQCSIGGIARYRAKISGPLMDRIDIHIEVPRPQSPEGLQPGMTSEEMRRMVHGAHFRRRERQRMNRSRGAEPAGAALRQTIALTKGADKLLRVIYDSLGISLRAHDRILKLARTIADIEGSDTVEEQHAAEAVSYRSLDRQLQALEQQIKP